MDELTGDFIAETREMLDAISGELVAWEADPGDRTRLDAIFRFVHTVKGSCGFLDLPRLARLSHAAEDALADVRAGRRTPDAGLVSAVLGVVDRIGELAEAIGSGESLDDGEDQRLVAALSQAAPVDPAPVAVAGVRIVGQPRTIRLAVDLLDRIMGGIAEVVLARNELALRVRARPHDTDIGDALGRLSTGIAEVRDAITRTRMQRVDHLYAALPRVVRDLSAELGRPVALELEGGEVELDREVIELIRDPLTHIIRNAIDHGIEPAAARVAAGKPATGSLRVGARQSGNHILIEAADDGRGIDGFALAARAVDAGLLEPGEAAALPWARKLALIFEPGLTTADAVTAISGRGVGMDVVRANVERIGGVIDIDSRPGEGTRIALHVPLTLTVVPALTVSAGGERFALPRAAIEEIVRLGSAGTRIEAVAGARLAVARGRRLPLVDLAELLALPVAGPAPTLVLLRPAGGDAFALAVEDAHDHEELIVKPAAPAVIATGLYAGTALSDGGRPMLLLDPAGLALTAGIVATAPPAPRDDPAPAPGLPTLLFRDLDGVERAIRLALVERVEEVARAQVGESAGRLRLAQDGRLIPLVAAAPLPEGPRLCILRLSDSDSVVAYAVDRVCDVVSLGAPAAATSMSDRAAGVLLVGDRPVELLDAHWLFAQAAVAGPAPLCLVGPSDDTWTREILRPLLEAAGYRVGFADRAPEEPPAVVIESEAAPLAASASTPVVRLRAAAQGDDGSVYRYDRAGLLAALDACIRQGWR